MNKVKSKVLTSSIKLLNDKLHFEGIVEGNAPISIHYTPPLGDNPGYTSLELFLLSLSSCAGIAILVLLRKMNKHIKHFEIVSLENRKENHPTGFSAITLHVNIKAKDLNNTEMEKVIGMVESICPVLSMLVKSISTTINFRIDE